MRIDGLPGPTAAATSRDTRSVRTSTFTIAGNSSGSPAAAAAVQTLGGIDALLVLQGVEDTSHRRQRAIRHGHTALDVLSELKLALLAGVLDGQTLARLRSLAASLGESSGDPGLDAILAEVALRVNVELAKLESHASVEGAGRSVRPTM